jgi:hypothetical protein
MTGGASPASDPNADPSFSLPSSENFDPVGYALAVDEALWVVSERLISRKHPFPTNLKNLQEGLVDLGKFMRQTMYPREAVAGPNELMATLRAQGDTLPGMLGRTLSSLSDYVETLEELGPSGDTINSPADFDAAVDAKGKKRDAFINEFDQLQLKFQETVRPLRPLNAGS